MELTTLSVDLTGRSHSLNFTEYLPMIKWHSQLTSRGGSTFLVSIHQKDWGMDYLEEFEQVLNDRYWPTLLDDLYGALTKLIQIGSVRHYVTLLDRLLARDGSLVDSRKLSEPRPSSKTTDLSTCRCSSQSLQRKIRKSKKSLNQPRRQTHQLHLNFSNFPKYA